MKGLMTTPDEILNFWFGKLNDGFADDEHRKRRFSGGESFAAQIRKNFAVTVSATRSNTATSSADLADSHIATMFYSEYQRLQNCFS